MGGAKLEGVDVGAVERDLMAWIERLCVPREELGNLPICPFARKAVKDKQVRIFVNDKGLSFQEFVEARIRDWEDPMHLVINVEVRTEEYTPEVLDPMMDALNDKYYRDDIFFVFDHPDYPVEINGVDTGNKKYALMVFQSLTKLHEAGLHLKKSTNYYSICPDRVTKEVVEYRNRYVQLKAESETE